MLEQMALYQCFSPHQEILDTSFDSRLFELFLYAVLFVMRYVYFSLEHWPSSYCPAAAAVKQK